MMSLFFPGARCFSVSVSLSLSSSLSPQPLCNHALLIVPTPLFSYAPLNNCTELSTETSFLRSHASCISLYSRCLIFKSISTSPHPDRRQRFLALAAEVIVIETGVDLDGPPPRVRRRHYIVRTAATACSLKCRRTSHRSDNRSRLSTRQTDEFAECHQRSHDTRCNRDEPHRLK